MWDPWIGPKRCILATVTHGPIRSWPALWALLGLLCSIAACAPRVTLFFLARPVLVCHASQNRHHHHRHHWWGVSAWYVHHPCSLHHPAALRASARLHLTLSSHTQPCFLCMRCSKAACWRPDAAVKCMQMTLCTTHTSTPCPTLHPHLLPGAGQSHPGQ